MPEREDQIQELLSEVRREAEELRRQHGSSKVPPLETPSAALESLHRQSGSPEAPRSRGIYASTLAELRKNLNPSDVAFTSHRGLIGRFVVFAKKALRQLMTPMSNRQTAFHQATIDALEQLEKEIASEGRDRLDALERRLTSLENSTGVRGSGETRAFDYAGFEERFRGSIEHVSQTQRRYLDHFPNATAGPVADLGCGRGEFMSLLAERDIASWGVELEPEYVREAVAKGLDVREEDAALALRGCEDQSLGGVVSFQVFEHLSLEKIARILTLAQRKLRPDGILIVETVNVASLITHSRAFTMDPTHQLALHPLTLKLLVEQRGFREVEISYSEEVADDTRLSLEGADPALALNLERLNELLFAPQDYAIVARA